MGRLQTWGAAARRSRPSRWWPPSWSLALVAGGIVLATRSATRPRLAPGHRPSSTRAVALGDSVPYGHGLANPYLTPQIGLPATRRLAGPLDAGLSRAWWRRTSGSPCRCGDQLPPEGDQLAISGAVADGADNTSRDGQCPVPPQQARNLADEMAAADLSSTRPAWSSCRTGPTTSTSAPASSTSWPASSGSASGSGTPASPTGPSRRRGRGPGQRPHQPGPGHRDRGPPRRDHRRARLLPADPRAVADRRAARPASGLHTNLVCSGLKPNAAGTFAAAQVVLAALNNAVAGAVADARPTT